MLSTARAQAQAARLGQQHSAASLLKFVLVLGAQACGPLL